MNLKSFYYDSFYQEFSFNNESINIVLLELLKYNITYPIHSLFEELKIYENKHLSSEWYQFIEHFDIDEDFLMLENRKGEFFGMGRNNQRFDLLNFDFSNLTNFPNTIIEFVNIQLKISFLNLSKYNFLQSTENPQYYDTYNLKYDKSKLYFNEFIQLELLDISKNVGRKSILGGYKMERNIMVYIETVDNSPVVVSLEAIALAKKLSKENNKKVIAVLVGENLDDVAKKCFEYGADEVLYLEENKKELEAIGNALIVAKEKYNPSIIFLGSTLNGKDLANMVASELKVPTSVDVVAVKYENDKYFMTLPMYGGNILKEVTFEGDKTLVVAVRSGACKKEVFEGASGEVIKEKVVEKNLFTKIAEIVQEISESVNLEEAEIIVSGGRGMGSKENFELVKQLADVCGGVVGATRPATEDEWIPRSHQVGQSGKIVAPKLYIACGISGATQHVSGIMGSNYIVAINKDEDAPIFDVADVGIVGNVMDIIPIMIEEIKKIKS